MEFIRCSHTYKTDHTHTKTRVLSFEARVGSQEKIVQRIYKQNIVSIIVNQLGHEFNNNNREEKLL